MSFAVPEKFRIRTGRYGTEESFGILAARLRDDKPLTPRLVEQARDEFDATVARLVDIPPGEVTSAIRTTEIAWEVKKLQLNGEAA